MYIIYVIIANIIHTFNNTINSLAYATTVLQLCKCSRKSTAGPIQATNTVVELMAMAVTCCGAEGTEAERGGPKQQCIQSY